MPRRKHASVTKFLCSLLAVAAFQFLALERADAALNLNWQQTGSDVTATLSGTIDSAWGAKNSYANVVGAGNYDNAFSGYSSQIRIGYGWSIGYDSYYIANTTFLPGVSLTGAQVSGGVVQLGYSPNIVFMDIGSNYVSLGISPGATSLNTSIVWSGHQLSDFFSSGAPVSSEVRNSSSQKLATLQIGAVPEPTTLALAGLAGLGMLWKLRRRK